MSVYENQLISKVNKRLERMYRMFGGSHESIDRIEFGIGLITGKNNVGIPKLYLRGLDPEQRTQMIQLAESYVNDPYSTAKGLKAMVNKGFNTLANDRNLNNNEVVALSRLFDDPKWQRLNEIERTSSEQIIEMVRIGVDKQFTPKQISDSILSWTKNSSNYDGSFYDYMNEKILGGK